MIGAAYQNRASGFTIVELLIVIVVIGILAGLVITMFAGTQQRARDASNIQTADQLKKFLESYYALHGAYPSVDQLKDPAWQASNHFSVDLLHDAKQLSLRGLDATTVSNNMNLQISPGTDCAYFLQLKPEAGDQTKTDIMNNCVNGDAFTWALGECPRFSSVDGSLLALYSEMNGLCIPGGGGGM